MRTAKTGDAIFPAAGNQKKKQPAIIFAKQKIIAGC